MVHSSSKNILILSPALSQSVACARLLRKYCPSTRLIGGWLPGERRYPSLRRLYHNLIEVHDVYDLEGYDEVIPTGATATKWLLTLWGKVRIGSAIMDRSALQVYDKLTFLRFAESQGVPIPRTWGSVVEMRDYDGPVFYKPRTEGTGGLRGWAKSVRAIPQNVQTSQYLFQEKIEGLGTYGVGFLAENGRILLATTHFEIYSFPRHGGSAAVIRPYFDDRLIELTARLLSALSYTGWGLAEFKWCPRRGEYVLMEINAKLWASIEFAFRIEPEWAKRFFGITVDRQELAGLIWPDRLLGSGLMHIAKAIPFMLAYPFVWEPTSLWNIAGKFAPSWVKRFARALAGTTNRVRRNPK